MRNLIQNLFLFYIRNAAQIQLAKIRALNSKFKIVGISGSAGKTSTMNALYAILKDHMSVKYSKKANSETGLPLDILGLHPTQFSMVEWLKIAIQVPIKLLTNWETYDIYIAEMGVDGINEPKNMRYLLRIFKPDIAIYLNVTATHFQFYEIDPNLSKEAVIDLIAADKALLIEALPKEGLAVLNGDDTRVLMSQTLAKCTVVTLQTKDFNEKIEIPGYLLPSHYQVSFYSALAVARHLGMADTTALESLKQNYKIEPGRSSIFEGKFDSTIIDSTYNSSKAPLLDTIDLMNETAKAKNALRVAILGDMRELGSAAQSEHEEVARYIQDKADYIYTVGPLMKKYFLPVLMKSGFATEKVKTFDRSTDCANELLKDLEKLAGKKVVMLKGSQNTIFLEIVVEKLLKNPQDVERLCRRGAFWNKTREGF